MVGLGLARGWARMPTPAGPQLITVLPWLTTTLGWLLPWRDPPHLLDGLLGPLSWKFLVEIHGRDYLPSGSSYLESIMQALRILMLPKGRPWLVSRCSAHSTALARLFLALDCLLLVVVVELCLAVVLHGLLCCASTPLEGWCLAVWCHSQSELVEPVPPLWCSIRSLVVALRLLRCGAREMTEVLGRPQGHTPRWGIMGVF